MTGTTTGTGTIREKMVVLPLLMITEYRVFQLAWPALINFFLNFSIFVFRKKLLRFDVFIDSLSIRYAYASLLFERLFFSSELLD